ATRATCAMNRDSGRTKLVRREHGHGGARILSKDQVRWQEDPSRGSTIHRLDEHVGRLRVGDRLGEVPRVAANRGNHGTAGWDQRRDASKRLTEKGPVSQKRGGGLGPLLAAKPAAER